MKKHNFIFITALLAVIFIMPMTVYADIESKQSAPILSVSNINSSENKLTWTKVDGAVSYIIYLLDEGTGKFNKYGEVKNNSCKDKNLSEDTKYTYKVAAKFSNGTLGSISEEVSCYTTGRLAGQVYGNWIYYIRDGKMIRQTRDGKKKKTLFDLSDSLRSSTNFVVTDKYIYYVRVDDTEENNDDTEEKTLLCRTDMKGKSEIVISTFYPDADEYYSDILDFAVYDNVLYYVMRSCAHETDYDWFNICAIDKKLKSVENSITKKSFLSEPEFITNENGELCIAVQEYDICDDEIVWKNSFCIYNLMSEKMNTVTIPDEYSKNIINCEAYLNNALYINTGSVTGYLKDNNFVKLNIPSYAKQIKFDSSGAVYYCRFQNTSDGISKKMNLYKKSEDKTIRIASVSYPDYYNYNYKIGKNYILLTLEDTKGRKLYIDTLTNKKIYLN